MAEAVVVAAKRTPIGKYSGSLATVRPDDLAAHVIKAVVEQSNISMQDIEEVYFGCANQAGEDNRNIARMATLLAGLPEEVAAVTLNRLCASSLTAINQASRAVRLGEGVAYIAGGVESMSRAPFSLPKAPNAFPLGNLTGWDTTLGWRYPNKKMEAMFPLESMGETAENIYEASVNGKITGGEITREEQDKFAFHSQEKAVRAIQEGYFNAEITPVTIPQRKGDPIVFSHDEHPRYSWEESKAVLKTSTEKLGKLRAAFRKEGTVTAGNSSGLNDGAAAVLITSEEYARENNLKPIARVIGSAASGTNPRLMGLGPVPAVKKLLKRKNLTIQDIDLVELNEAFAVQSIAVIRELGLNPDIVNVNGGAIALGHPLGCSGARIVATLLSEMKRRADNGEKVRYGLATLCVGVGQGEATLFELLS